jgi:hypothetical protein
LHFLNRLAPAGGLNAYVEMDVVRMTLKILFVTDDMLPEPSLPDTPLTLL